MSTKAQIRFATREVGVSFNEHPDKIHAQFYVHNDGYPSGLGVDIAKSIVCSPFQVNGLEIEHIQTQHGDLDYIYYIWSDYNKTTWISIFKESYIYCPSCGQPDNDPLDPETPYECIFVGTPEQLIQKYKLNTNEEG
jgi:hypothetical protein